MLIGELMNRLMMFDVDMAAKMAIGQKASYYEALNRFQLSQGLRADKTVLPDYSITSVNVFGKRPGPIMLYDTGAFYESFQLDVGTEDVELVADDLYELEERYGSEIYGLTDESHNEFVEEELRPALMEIFEHEIWGA